LKVEPERVLIDFERDVQVLEALEFAGEVDTLRKDCVVQRFFPEAVAG